MKKVFLFVLLLNLPVSSASEQKLLTLTNDRDALVSDLDFQVDAQGAVQGLQYNVHDSGQTTVKNFTMAELGAAEGVVLEDQQGVKALLLRGHADVPTGKGQFVIRFINNGLSGDYKECNINLSRGGTGIWTLFNAYTGKAVDAAKVLTWSLGIQTIDGICP
jgi:hypothetical protein